MKGKAVLILGATSSMARSLCCKLAQQGAILHLAGRDAPELERIACDIAIRYQTPVTWSRVDATQHDTHPEFFQQVLERLGRLDGVMVTLGELGEQAQAQQDFQQAYRILSSNYTGVVSLLTPIANYLEKQQGGFIVGVSSVAGDRGRQSNYIYGSAKGGLSLFLQGLRNRLTPAGVQVLTVKPGFVDTKMTFGKPGMFLVASPEQVADDILKALSQNRDILYTPSFWWGIMAIIRSIPEPLFKRMKL
ncbi:SDR family oxidoreductase [Desertifilum sp. FACHB-1129]|uniref:Short-chain dehydrogenase n=1 Tax=Desertifilum tharense IPPAS B-1220 TaxID=1781255 RepID=A0A1E5QR78_9CYAN|nr:MULTISPECIES: SDR family oxidoreductase [Desertifilum]MDA0210723.1 SDR family oxidoreductase [Cyanobacteria bacterium FC1]MBD2312209.1 SDR family oxidoreductase [Desertifilum sp. FACHB-1129]MBD2323724.1 SDR family oxidoreductase [Desertifilum sp. FACHB-866]MBD2332421.1 SDR family oxidoreductase [Desertifilum sp. FACHB-868]OEJ77104.1 short-chain dehydrogenase [Desertifilum tharense IPPAS B-1220]